VARRKNYGFEKRQREAKKKKKKEPKLEKKRLKSAGGVDGVPVDGETPETTDEETPAVDEEAAGGTTPA
jgi:hypothetical protein